MALPTRTRLVAPVPATGVPVTEMPVVPALNVWAAEKVCAVARPARLVVVFGRV